ncbi:conserved uncharacterized protein [Desulfobacula toluolica Tol2]|uniref:Conserved uncharacterized protein n=2 Tax=Desulfobacula toluolica TaxID=28223 RepID=K0NP01_DESTT|nr:conserved uncharacterized protein [Desulfobacula toluolica Tol2]
MLNSIKNDADAVFFTAVENVEDVSHQTVENGVETNYFEEDKNYDLCGNFTIFSPPVKNTLVSFFDIYLGQFKNSKNVYLGFYTTRAIGKERKNKLNDGTEIDLPETSILSLLSSGKKINGATTRLVKAILIEEYIEQYKGKPYDGFLESLKNMSEKDFIDFLMRIKWYFGEENEEDLKQTVLKDIEASTLHSSAHIGKESIIFSSLMEKLDEKQNKESLLDRLVHSSDVKLIFAEARSEVAELNMDPTWRHYNELEEEITDKRNLKEKIQAIIDDYPERKIRHLAKKACRSKTEQSSSNKTFLSLKYRVHEACSDYFFEEDYTPPENGDDLNRLIKELLSESVKSIEELKKDYQYSVSNSKIIEGIILDLFDSCFFAFDELEHEK